MELDQVQGGRVEEVDSDQVQGNFEEGEWNLVHGHFEEVESDQVQGHFEYKYWYCGGCIRCRRNNGRRIGRGGSSNRWFRCRRNNSRAIGRDIIGCWKKYRGAVVVVIVVTGAGSTGVE